MPPTSQWRKLFCKFLDQHRGTELHRNLISVASHTYQLFKTRRLLFELFCRQTNAQRQKHNLFGGGNIVIDRYQRWQCWNQSGFLPVRRGVRSASRVGRLLIQLYSWSEMLCSLLWQMLAIVCPFYQSTDLYLCHAGRSQPHRHNGDNKRCSESMVSKVAQFVQSTVLKIHAIPDSTYQSFNFKLCICAYRMIEDRAPSWTLQDIGVVIDHFAHCLGL